MGPAVIDTSRTSISDPSLEIFQTLGIDGDERDDLPHGDVLAAPLVMVPQGDAGYPLSFSLLVVSGAVDRGLYRKKTDGLGNGLRCWSPGRLRET